MLFTPPLFRSHHLISIEEPVDDYKVYVLFFRDLSHNQLSGISEGSFVELEKLEELDLAHNQISCIDRNALASLRSLRYL